VDEFKVIANHRDTKNTEVAQREENKKGEAYDSLSGKWKEKWEMIYEK
jgi:hypothetical protein